MQPRLPFPPPPGQWHRATAPSPGRPTPGVVKQDKSSGGSVDTTKTRSGPQRVRMSSGERPIGATKGNQTNTMASCQPPLPPREVSRGLVWRRSVVERARPIGMGKGHQGSIQPHSGPLQPRDAVEGKAPEAPEAVRQAVGGGCQGGWGQLLSATNAIKAGAWRQGDSGWA